MSFCDPLELQMWSHHAVPFQKTLEFTIRGVIHKFLDQGRAASKAVNYTLYWVSFVIHKCSWVLWVKMERDSNTWLKLPPPLDNKAQWPSVCRELTHMLHDCWTKHVNVKEKLWMLVTSISHTNQSVVFAITLYKSSVVLTCAIE